MAEKIRWGIMATGGIATQFAKGLLHLQSAQIAAVASRTEQKARAFADKFSIGKYYPSYQQLAEDPDIDAIYIATPHPMHCENAIMCLENKKPVLCEKPLAVNAEQARKMVAAAEQNNTFLMEAMWTRFLPAVVEVREWIKDGLIGEPKMLIADFGINPPRDPEARHLNPHLGGGALLDLGVYPVSFASMLFGPEPPTDIASVAHLGPTGVDEVDAISLKYPNQCVASINCSMIAITPRLAVIAGSDGLIKLGPPFWGVTKAVIEKAKSFNYEIVKEFTQPMGFGSVGLIYQVEHVQRDIIEGRIQNEIMPHPESITIMETMDRLREQWGLKYPGE